MALQMPSFTVHLLVRVSVRGCGPRYSGLRRASRVPSASPADRGRRLASSNVRARRRLPDWTMRPGMVQSTAVALMRGRMGTQWIFAYFLPVVGFVLALLLLAHLLRQRRPPSSTMAWMLAIVLAPVRRRSPLPDAGRPQDPPHHRAQGGHAGGGAPGRALPARGGKGGRAAAGRGGGLPAPGREPAGGARHRRERLRAACCSPSSPPARASTSAPTSWGWTTPAAPSSTPWPARRPRGWRSTCCWTPWAACRCGGVSCAR